MISKLLYITSIIAFIMVSVCKCEAQIINPYGSYEINDSISLILRKDKSFELYRSNIDVDSDELYGHQPSIDYNTIIKGFFLINDSIICLTSKINCHYCNQKLLLLDNDRIVIMNGNCFDFKEDTIYVTRKISQNSQSVPEYVGTWKEGKKDNWWSYFNIVNNKLVIIKIKYENGRPVDTIQVEN